MKFINFNNYLAKVFLLLLIVSQAIIFVSLKAAPTKQIENLGVNFFLSQSSFQPGDKALWLASLTEENNWQVVNFLLENKEQNISLYFQTFKNEEGFYQSDSFWQTEDYPSGEYQLSLIAQNFDVTGNIIQSKQSASQNLYLAAAIKAAVVDLEQNKTASSTQEGNVATSTSPAVEEFLSPLVSAEVSGQNFPVRLKINQILNQDQIVGAAIFALDGALVTTLSLTQNQDDKQLYEGVLADSSLYTNGDYYLVVWLNNDQQYISEPLVFNINNVANETVDLSDPNNYSVTLLSPQNNSQVSETEFLLSFSTNFDASSLGFLLFKEDDPSLGIEQTINRGDGFSWSQLVEIDQSFRSGKYILSAIAVDLNGVIFEENFNLNFVLKESTDFASSTNPLLPVELVDENSSSTVATSSEEIIATSTLDIILTPYLDEDCLAENIQDVQACEEYLSRIYVEKECADANIFNLQDCQNYTIEKYLPKIQCFLSDQSACQNILSTTYLNRASVKEQARSKTESLLKNYLNQNISIKNLQANFSTEDFTDFLPLDNEVTKEVFVTPATTYTVLQTDGALDFSSSAVLVFDQDQDALTDDLELYYGTDINNPDTDNDTYLDGQEVANNYNPLGVGALNKEVNNLVKILHQGLNLDQPKNNNLFSNDLSIDEFSIADNKVLLKGKAPADTWLNLYIYSKVPLLLSVKSDSQGDWNYSLDQALAATEHQIYLTVNDQQGKIVKQSMPLALKIDEQKQVDDEQDSPQIINNDKTIEIDNNINFWLTYRWYIVGLGVLVIILFSTYLFFKFRKEKTTL